MKIYFKNQIKLNENAKRLYEDDNTSFINPNNPSNIDKDATEALSKNPNSNGITVPISSTDNNQTNNEPTIKINAEKGQIGSAIQRVKSQNPSLSSSNANIEVDTNQNESFIVSKKMISEKRLKNLRKQSVGIRKIDLQTLFK